MRIAKRLGTNPCNQAVKKSETNEMILSLAKMDKQLCRNKIFGMVAPPKAKKLIIKLVEQKREELMEELLHSLIKHFKAKAIVEDERHNGIDSPHLKYAQEQLFNNFEMLMSEYGKENVLTLIIKSNIAV